nr:bifunctional folylpolyglutamate synthase/dihydrofolate synthase [Lachnospiraceae bacterium]
MIDKITADEFTDKIKSLGSKPGLDRIHTLLNRLGNPEKDLKVIHIAGTNGKGSVCAMLQFALFYNDYKVGKFSSPSVFSEYEQYMINDEEISELEYLGFLSNIIDVTKDLSMDEMPTYFEVQ